MRLAASRAPGSRRAGFVLSAALLFGCAGPPPDAYVGGGGTARGGIALGRNAAGESCTQQDGRGGTNAAIFCGTWNKPSGTVQAVASNAGGLDALANSSAWRSGLDARFNCAAPVHTAILGAVPAVELSCTRRVGGWPQVALAAVVDGRFYTADGILPAEPVLERSIGVLSGRVAAQAAPALPPGQAEELLASRLAAQSFGAGDINRYGELMRAGVSANLDESYVAAEQAYRAALALQRRALGADDPATATPTMLIALQLADQGRGPEAEALFERASRLAARSPSATVRARLEHYRGLALLDDNRPADALDWLRRAEIDYAALLPPGMAAGDGERAGTDAQPPLDPDTQAALVGVVETRRYQAICLRDLERGDEARARIRAASALAAASGLRQGNLTARLLRTRAEIDEQMTPGSGRGDLGLASTQFAIAQPGTRPIAQTALLRAAEALRGGDRAGAIGLCRQAGSLLDALRSGTTAELVAPCLQAYADAANAAGTAGRQAERQALLSDMFAASQLVQGSITSRQIALATARLGTGSKDPAVAAAIRRQQDSSLLLADLERQRDALPPGSPDAAALERRVADARTALGDADAVLQAAAPNYGALVQRAAAAREVLSALEPDEAFVSIVLTPDGGWVFALRNDAIDVAPAGAGGNALAAAVRRIRASAEPTEQGLPAFDVADARMVYDDTVGRVAGRLDGAHALVVAPSGPLLSIPLELLLTGPADAGDLARAPFLVRRYALSHVPAPANFVSLRRASAAAVAANTPWFGFGDFRPVTLTQAEKSFPAGTCAESAKLFAELPPLPFAARELTAARQLLGGAAADQLTGGAFTAPAVLKQDLNGVRVLHFATHALLPTDLRCETEPAIVTSAPAGAPSANGALLTASDLMGMRLDADVVIISACNSAGPDGSTAGESLSGLARSFFYAGARAVMVTHWSVNDQATAYLVAGTVARLRHGDPAGLAGALRGTQLAMLDQAGHGMPATVAHPFFWAPFAIVGEGRGRTGSPVAGTPPGTVMASGS